MMLRENLIKWLVGLALLWVMPAMAQVPAQGEILKIEIRLAGAPTGVDENFVRSHIRLKVGDTYRAGLENEDVKALVLHDFARARRHVFTTLNFKLSYWRQLPWVIMSLGHHSAIVAMECARRALELFATAPSRAAAARRRAASPGTA